MNHNIRVCAKSPSEAAEFAYKRYREMEPYR
jgi:hypothetical protein